MLAGCPSLQRARSCTQSSAGRGTAATISRLVCLQRIRHSTACAGWTLLESIKDVRGPLPNTRDLVCEGYSAMREGAALRSCLCCASAPDLGGKSAGAEVTYSAMLSCAGGQMVQHQLRLDHPLPPVLVSEHSDCGCLCFPAGFPAPALLCSHAPEIPDLAKKPSSCRSWGPGGSCKRSALLWLMPLLWVCGTWARQQ